MYVIVRNKNKHMGKIALFVRDRLYKDKIQIFHKCYDSRNTVHSQETRNHKQLIEPRYRTDNDFSTVKSIICIRIFFIINHKSFLWFLSYIIFVIVLLSYIYFFSLFCIFYLVFLLHWNCNAVMIMSMVLLFFLSVTNKISTSFLGNHPTFV